MRDWVDNTGLFRVRGRVHQILDRHVRLLKDNGRFSTVPLRRLSPEDLQYVMQLRAEFGVGLIGHVASR